MNESRTDSKDYDKTPNWLHADPTELETKIAIEKEVEKIEEFFVWSDDKLAIYDLATKIVESNDNLKESLMLIVSCAIGTDKVNPHLINQFIIELTKTVKELATTRVESKE